MNNMNGRALLTWLALILLSGAGCRGNRDAAAEAEKTPADSLMVFCGSANKPAMTEIAALYERETGTQVNLQFGGSGTLLSQIELSRKGDIYIPGSPDYIIKGVRKKLLVEGTDRIVAYLVPAIITPADNPAGIGSLEDLARPGVRVGLGNPKTVCLGLYGVELLERNHLLEPVMKNVVTFGASCSMTANLAAMNQVDAILGWRVFHFWNPDRMAYVPVDSAKIPRVSYIPISIPVFTEDRKRAQAFIDFVLSEHGRKIYKKHGYITSREEALTFATDASIGGEYPLPDDYDDLVKQMGGGK